ncbi:MAG: hypothetical protein AAGF84_01205 [Planctomycetota bacterium]
MSATHGTRYSRVVTLVIVLSAWVGGMPTNVRAQVTWDFNFLDDPGVGFNAWGATGQDRRAGMMRAGEYLSGVLGPAYSATIEIDVIGSVTDDFALAAATPFFNASYPGDGFRDYGDVQLKILGGNNADPAPTLPDGEVVWNFEDFAWAPLDDFQPGELDLISTAIHELTHTIGFYSDVFPDGSSCWDEQPGVPTAWGPFDEFIADAEGRAIIGSNGALDIDRWNSAYQGGPGALGLQFIGPHAVEAAGGPIYLYSPALWEPGSSVSHLDTDYYDPLFDREANLMNHTGSVFEGQDIRVLNDLELAMLRDLGYTELVGNLVAALSGDFDGSGIVEQGDLNLVLSNWGQTRGAWENAEGFDTTAVDQEELNRVLSNWGDALAPDLQGVVAGAIPEPSCLVLVGGFAVIRSRWRRA